MEIDASITGNNVPYSLAYNLMREQEAAKDEVIRVRNAVCELREGTSNLQRHYNTKVKYVDNSLSHHNALVEKASSLITEWDMKFNDSSSLTKACDENITTAATLTTDIQTTTTIYLRKLRDIRNSFMNNIHTEIQNSQGTRNLLTQVQKRLEELSNVNKDTEAMKKATHHELNVVQHNHHDVVIQRDTLHQKLQQLQKDLFSNIAVLQHIETDYERTNDNLKNTEDKLNNLQMHHKQITMNNQSRKDELSLKLQIIKNNINEIRQQINDNNEHITSLRDDKDSMVRRIDEMHKDSINIPVQTTTLVKEIEEAQVELNITKPEETKLQKIFEGLAVDTIVEEAILSKQEADLSLTIIEEALQFVTAIDMTVSEELLAIRSRLGVLHNHRFADPDVDAIQQSLEQAFADHYSNSSITDSISQHQERYGDITNIIPSNTEGSALTKSAVVNYPIKSTKSTLTVLEQLSNIHEKFVDVVVPPVHYGKCSADVAQLVTTLRDSAAPILTQQEYSNIANKSIQNVIDTSTNVSNTSTGEATTEILSCIMNKFLHHSTVDIPNVLDTLVSLLNGTNVPVPNTADNSQSTTTTTKPRRKKSTNGNGTPSTTPTTALIVPTLSQYMQLASKAQSSYAAQKQLEDHLQQLEHKLHELQNTYNEYEHEIQRLQELLRNDEQQYDLRIHKLEKQRDEFEATAKQTLDDTEHEYEKIITNKKLTIENINKTIQQVKQQVKQIEDYLRKLRRA